MVCLFTASLFGSLILNIRAQQPTPEYHVTKPIPHMKTCSGLANTALSICYTSPAVNITRVFGWEITLITLPILRCSGSAQVQGLPHLPLPSAPQDWQRRQKETEQKTQQVKVRNNTDVLRYGDQSRTLPFPIRGEYVLLAEVCLAIYLGLEFWVAIF